MIPSSMTMRHPRPTRNPRRRKPAHLAVLFGLLLLVPPSSQADVVKVVVNDTIHPITEEYIGRALEQAKTNKDAAVLIEMRTPGGLGESMQKIIEKILASPVPVIVYVAPSGSSAASAGFFILVSADVAAMAPGTNTGAAHPVILGVKLDDTMNKKLENDAAAFLRSFVAKRGRNVEVAESAVRESKSFTHEEALSHKLIDVIAKDESDLLKQLEGRTVKRFDGSTTVLRVADQKVRLLEMTLKQRILAFLIDPNVAFILFSLGMLCLYIEMNHPGAILPGVIGFILILLAVFALQILPTSYAALALILSSFVLFALEAKFQSGGVLAAGGIFAMVLGALLLVDGPIPEMRVRLLTALVVSIPMGLITVFLMTIALRAQRNKVTTGEEGLIGELAIAHTPLSPQGKVYVGGELWNASAPPNVSLPEGARVRIRAIKGLELEVEPENSEAAPTR
jgi:membrane-bound serine protease (ClpP class)